MSKYTGILTVSLLFLAACNDSGVSGVGNNEFTDENDQIEFSFENEGAVFTQVQLNPTPVHALPRMGPVEAKTNTVGSSTTGQPFSVSCGSNQVLAGIQGRHGSAIDQVQALCVSVNGSGTWSGRPQPTDSPAGGGGGGPFISVCPDNNAVNGFLGYEHNGGFVGALQIKCKPLDSHATVSGQAVSLTAEGGNPDSFSVSNNYDCAANAAARGIHGRSGRLVDQFGLSCKEGPTEAGRWSNIIDWPLIAIHSVLTPQGKVFSFGSERDGTQGAQFYYDLWDPVTNEHTTLDNTLGVDSFCSAPILLPENGNILMPGGDGRPNGARNSGIFDVPVFDTQSNSLSRAADLNLSRWYASAVTLANGEILITGGTMTNRQPATTPEVYSPQSDEWRSLFGINTTGNDWYYPKHWVAPDGRVFGIARNKLYYIDTDGGGSITDAGLTPTAYGFGSTAVMFQPGKILQVGGSGNGGRTAVEIDITSGEPKTTILPAMSNGRVTWSNAVVLPNGKVLVVGGGQGDNVANSATYQPELWDPATRQWEKLSRHQRMRLYHSTALLLQDGRILLAGGGAPGPVTNLNAEIFSPPYLFDEAGILKPRPVIDWAPEQATFGDQITVRVSSNREIERITLIKTSSVTHSANFEQRFTELQFSGNEGEYLAQLPNSANLITPGFYLIYALDTAGTPSEATMVQIGNTPAPSPPPRNDTPVVDNPSSLIANGGFEDGKTSWQDCSDPSLSALTTNSSSGSSAIALSQGACLFQEFQAFAGVTYSVSCDTATSSNAYASMSI